MRTPVRKVFVSFAFLTAAAGAAAPQGFQSGDLYIVSTSINPPVPPPFQGPGITRVDPFLGTATFVRLLNTLQSNAVFDPFRGKLVLYGVPSAGDATGAWAFDAAGNAALLTSTSGTMDRLSSAGDGRIYFVNSFRQLRYLDALNVAHDVLDAAGTAVFTFPTAYASADHAVHYDAATNAVYAAWNGANVCGGGLVATPEITRVPLNGAGTQVSGPTFSNSICISIAGGSSPGDAFTPTSLTPGPEGKLFLSCDNNAYVQCGRQVLIDKSTLTATTYATTTAYFGSPAADAGCYSSALGRGILLDTFSDAVRAFAQGSVGEGSIVVQGGLVSSSGGSAENTDILEIPYGVFGGLANFGTGSPGCNGPQVMGASSIPSPGNASFRLTTLACPPNSLGLGLATNSPDLFGSDPFALGVKLHVDLFAATEIYSFDVNSNVFGLGLTVAPVAISPAIVGNTYYAQSLWAWTGCTANPPFNLSTSNGLAVTIQP